MNVLTVEMSPRWRRSRSTASTCRPPAIMALPVKWGDEETVRERFRDGIGDLSLSRQQYPFRYPFPPAEVVEFFRSYYGPTVKAFAALRQDLEQLWAEHNTATDGTTALTAEYLQVVAVRR